MAIYLTDFNADGILKGRPSQDVHNVSDVQYFPIGTKLERHGRIWRYCRAEGAVVLPCRGHYNKANQSWTSTQVYALRGYGVNAAPIGTRRLVVKVDDEGVANQSYTAKNYFAGGFAIVYNIAGDNGIIGIFRISGNEPSVVNAVSADYEDIVVYLDEDLPYTLTPAASPATSVDLYPSPYMNVASAAGGVAGARFVVVPMVAAGDGQFFWGQTVGPCMVTPDAGITSAADHEVVFQSDGTVIVRSTDTEAQRAGYMLQKADGSNDDPLIMLQLE